MRSRRRWGSRRRAFCRRRSVRASCGRACRATRWRCWSTSRRRNRRPSARCSHASSRMSPPHTRKSSPRRFRASPLRFDGRTLSNRCPPAESFSDADRIHPIGHGINPIAHGMKATRHGMNAIAHGMNAMRHGMNLVWRTMNPIADGMNAMRHGMSLVWRTVSPGFRCAISSGSSPRSP